VERSRAELIASGTVRLADLVRPDLGASEADAPTLVLPPPALEPQIQTDIDVVVEWDSTPESAPVASDAEPRTWGPSVSSLRWARLGCLADRPTPRAAFPVPARTTSFALRTVGAVLLAGAAALGLSIGVASRSTGPEEPVAGAPRSAHVPVTTHASFGGSSAATERAMPASVRPVVRRASPRPAPKAKATGLLDIL
jgi:hypothetical protein